MVLFSGSEICRDRSTSSWAEPLTTLDVHEFAHGSDVRFVGRKDLRLAMAMAGDRSGLSEQHDRYQLLPLASEMSSTFLGYWKAPSFIKEKSKAMEAFYGCHAKLGVTRIWSNHSCWRKPSDWRLPSVQEEVSHLPARETSLHKSCKWLTPTLSHRSDTTKYHRSASLIHATA